MTRDAARAIHGARVDQLIRANPDIGGAHDQIMCGAIFDLRDLVRHQARVLMMPAVHQS